MVGKVVQGPTPFPGFSATRTERERDRERRVGERTWERGCSRPRIKKANSFFSYFLLIGCSKNHRETREIRENVLLEEKKHQD